MSKFRKIAPYIICISVPLLFLIPVQIILTEKPMILAERFFKNGGWVEIFFLTVYSILLTRIMLNLKNIIKWRTRYWLLFSIIFFTQFVLGIFVNEKFLMTGELHLPVPALIIAGPVFRSGGFFMLTLLFSTILLAGPTWCSHLCYIGAWDNIAAKSRFTKKKFSRKTTIIIRYLMIILVLLIAFILNVSGASGITAFIVALIFGITGVLLMFFVSRKKGYMVHCTTYCPIGGIVVLFGKIFPVKVQIEKTTCTLCSNCSLSCRYDALSIENIKSGKAGWNCTLCGDCLTSCNHNSIIFSFFGRKINSWDIYIAFVVGLHTVFIALARL